jgi:hypothetical protein
MNDASFVTNFKRALLACFSSVCVVKCEDLAWVSRCWSKQLANYTLRQRVVDWSDTQTRTIKEGHDFAHDVGVMGNLERKKHIYLPEQHHLMPWPWLLRKSRNGWQCGALPVKSIE